MSEQVVHRPDLAFTLLLFTMSLPRKGEGYHPSRPPLFSSLSSKSAWQVRLRDGPEGTYPRCEGKAELHWRPMATLPWPEGYETTWAQRGMLEICGPSEASVVSGSKLKCHVSLLCLRIQPLHDFFELLP